MKKTFLRFILLVLSSIMLISSLVSCGDGLKRDTDANENKDPISDEEIDPNRNFADKESVTFMPAEPSDRGVDEFMEIFRESKFYADFLEYGECFNLMPENVSTEYGIDAFSLIARDETQYYVLYDGKIFRADSIGGRDDADHGFVQFALADYNSDGYFELLCSYNASREPDENGRWDYCHSHIFAMDSRTGIGEKTYTYYDGLIFFKKGEDGLFDAYSSKDKNPDNANMLCYDLQKNTTRYKFAKETVTLTSNNYKAVVTVREGTAHFPLVLDSMSLSFEVDVEMTYLGETFTYTNPTGYLAGAVPRFECGEDTVPMEGWFEATVVSQFTVTTGQVITRDYQFLNSLKNPSKEGVYDLIVEYRGEEVKLENFLEVTCD